MDAEMRELCERLRGLLAKATPGEWFIVHGVVVANHGTDFPSVASLIDEQNEEADGALIVAAVNTLPRLLNAIAAQAAEIERLKVDGIHSCDDECQRPMCVLRRENARLAAELDGVRKDAEERVRLHHYWRQRAKSAEGHLFASDLTHAAMAIHARSLKAETPWEELDWREKGARLGCAMDVIVRVNNRRDERLPKDTAIADSGEGGGA